MSDTSNIRTATTYRFELWRAATAGILETAATTFLLLIALRWYAAGSFMKGIVAGSGSLGLLLSPAIVELATRWRIPPARASAVIMGLGASLFFVAAIWHYFPVFVFCTVTAMTCSAGIIPLLTHMYQENYPEERRGRLFSRTIMVRIAMAALFSELVGVWLTHRLSDFPWLLALFGLAMAFASFCLWNCPTSPISPDESAHPLRSLRFIKEDAVFRLTLICWMLMGFANLMMLPLRVEYLGNPRYQHHLSVGAIALFTSVIPNVARLLLSPVWGYLFDHMNFFALRVTLNIGFAIGILSFFASGSWAGLFFGAVVFGISTAGGDVAWSLWVTKFAPTNRVADYMAIHTSLTGLRGVLAPVVAFYVVTRLPLITLAALSTGLIGLATLLLLPEIKMAGRGKSRPALTEEITE